jgi:hypothetical protein
MTATEQDRRISAMQRFAQALTAIPSWIQLPSGVVPLAGWRWFISGDHIVLEPRDGIISPRHMTYLDMHARTTDVEAVFRAAPNPGVYLQFKLLDTEDL